MHLGASVCVCGVDVGSARDARIRGVYEVIWSEILVRERFGDVVCGRLTLLEAPGVVLRGC